MIRRASKNDEPALKTMWKLCFGDSEKAVNFIFKMLLKPEDMLVAEDENGKPAAMLSIREFELGTIEQSCRAAYVFAVATMPEHQGKGYSTALLNDMHSRLACEGYACSALVPAEKSLFGFYGKRGYETSFRLNKATVGAGEIEAGGTLELSPLPPENIRTLRDHYFGDSGLFARWDEDYIRFIEEDCRFWGGGAFGFSADGQAGYAVCYRSGNKLLVKELAAPENMLKPVLSSIHARFGAEEYILYLRENISVPYKNNVLPFAMVKWYDNDIKIKMQSIKGAPPYIAHILD